MPENPTPSFENLTRSVADPATTTGTDTSSTASAPLPLPSARYQLGEELARGGMGVVYRATDVILGREVAVKVLQADQGPLSAVARRFTDEAHIAAQLQHPAIPPIHDLGTLPDGRPFLAMKLIKGETLESLLKSRPNTASDHGRFVTAFEQVCQAIAFAHDRGVIHRDLKPANVMVGAFGEVQVMDWGLAKVRGGGSKASEPDPEETSAGTVIHSHREDQAHTQAGSVLGTPAYMPPEQALGAVGKIDARSDVFGLGAVLAVILTGKPPFEAGSAETTRIKAAQGKVDECFARLESCGADPELVALAKRCLSPNPDDRPVHAGEVARAVAALRAAADERARQAEMDKAKAEVHAAEQRTRRKVQLALVAAVGLLVIGGGAFAWWQDKQATQKQRKVDALRAEADRRLAAGLEAARAGDADRAVAALVELSGLCQRAEELTDKWTEVTDHLARIERHRAFRTHAETALRYGVHNIRSREKSDPLIQQCEAALAVYQIEARADWDRDLDGSALTPAQVAEIRRTAHDLLVMLAIRLALFDTRDEAGQANTRRALALLDRAASLREPGVGVLTLRMLWHRRLKENAEADRHGDAAVAAAKAKKPATALDHYLLGSVTLQIMKKPKEAAEVYQRALKQQPDHYGAHFGLFLCYEELKEPVAQIAHLTACLMARPDDLDLRYFRGMASFALGQTYGEKVGGYRTAFDDFDAMVGRDPASVRGNFYRGRMQVVFEEWAKAEADFDRAVRSDPSFTQGVSWRGVARAKVGRHKDAAADAEEAVRREPDDRLTLYFAAWAYAQAVRAARADKAEPEREALAGKYAARAVELLGRAIEKGFRESDRLARGGDFTPLHDRPDFQALLKKLADLALTPRALAPPPREVRPKP